jgi:hypothetical protein
LPGSSFNPFQVVLCFPIEFTTNSCLLSLLQATAPLGNHNDRPISLSFVAAHGSDKFLLRAISDMYSTIQEQVVSASKLAPPPVINHDVDASELLKEKVYLFHL